jgi:hypothetical protein
VRSRSTAFPAVPPAAIGGNHGTGLQTVGYNTFAAVAPGKHVATVEWNTFPAGATSGVEERRLIRLQP